MTGAPETRAEGLTVKPGPVSCLQLIRRLIYAAGYIMGVSLTGFAQPGAAIEKFIAINKVPGIFVAVVRHDSVVYQKSAGVADLQRGTPLTASSCMELGSISKGFTAEVIYRLHQTGALDIQDPVRKYFPDAPHSWSAITIRHLLTHTSGLTNYLADPRFHAAAYFTNAAQPGAARFFDTVTPDSMVKLFYSLPLEFRPGFTWSYSNTGYYLLGKIAEVAAGKPFFKLVEEEVTAPLQMTSTEANDQSAGKGCLTGGYFFTDSALTPARVLRSNYAFSAGAWATTGQDMIRYLKAIHLRNLPSDKGGFNWRKAPHQGDLPFTYEGGRFYSTFHGLDVISHNGGTPGFSSSWIYVPQKNTSIIVLMNRQDYAAVDQLAWELLSFFEPALEYPRRRRTGAAEQKMEQRVMAALTALRSGAPLPHGLARPLVHFLKSDQGSGYWKWYFERGFPAAVRCVDTEPIGKAKLYRFLLTFSEEVAYQFSVLENEKGELTQMRWW